MRKNPERGDKHDQRTLALFFTRNVSLEDWLQAGLLDREKWLYERHLTTENLTRVVWVTYGTHDAVLAERLQAAGELHPGITVLPRPRLFHRGPWCNWVYSFLIPLVHRQHLRGIRIFKTNQLDGFWAPLLCCAVFGGRFLLRTGYTLSYSMQQGRRGRLRTFAASVLEYAAYKSCHAAIVSSNHDKAYLAARYPGVASRIRVVHNAVDTDRFRPQGTRRYSERLLYVGRLEPEKNLHNLIQACLQLRLPLDIVGAGRLRGNLESWCKAQKAEVSFQGTMPNHQLPLLYNQYQYYVLPSLYEGMPKTLLEAMACGLVCIGTDVPGIREVLDDGVDGFLARNTEASALAEAIQRARNCPFGLVLAKNARRKVCTQYSLEKAVVEEDRILRSLTENRRPVKGNRWHLLRSVSL
jgi:glycosyltransferase involved in cell wall biosynthesis